MTVNDDLINGLVVLPDEARQLAHKYVDELADTENRFKGVTSGLPNLDKVLNPLKDGQMRVIMGRPSNGKTALMMHYSREAAALLNPNKSAPVFVSAEMAVEELMMREVSNFIPVNSLAIERGEMESWKGVHDAIDELAVVRPIIYVGHSLSQGRKRPRMSVENIVRGLNYIVDKTGKPPILLSIDYAQRLRLDKISRDRRVEVSEIVESVKDMALQFATPVQLGSQVGRQVDERKPPVPTLADAKETANLEETADSVLAVMRPSRYYDVGLPIPSMGGKDLICEENLFFISVLKQRQGLTGGFWCYFDMSISKVADLEFERIDFNDY